tara:strand:- start:3363 stop:3590 length:228 start_codon:yes stop_codon:yes gene_type:complete
MSDNVTEKIQVLISPYDMRCLNSLIMIDAIQDGTRPIPLSTFVRNIIKEYIEQNSEKLEQKSFVGESVKKYTNKK